MFFHLEISCDSLLTCRGGEEDEQIRYSTVKLIQAYFHY